MIFLFVCETGFYRGEASLELLILQPPLLRCWDCVCTGTLGNVLFLYDSRMLKPKANVNGNGITVAHSWIF